MAEIIYGNLALDPSIRSDFRGKKPIPKEELQLRNRMASFLGITNNRKQLIKLDEAFVKIDELVKENADLFDRMSIARATELKEGLILAWYWFGMPTAQEKLPKILDELNQSSSPTPTQFAKLISHKLTQQYIIKWGARNQDRYAELTRKAFEEKYGTPDIITRPIALLAKEEKPEEKEEKIEIVEEEQETIPEEIPKPEEEVVYAKKPESLLITRPILTKPLRLTEMPAKEPVKVAELEILPPKEREGIERMNREEEEERITQEVEEVERRAKEYGLTIGVEAVDISKLEKSPVVYAPSGAGRIVAVFTTDQYKKIQERVLKGETTLRDELAKKAKILEGKIPATGRVEMYIIYTIDDFKDLIAAGTITEEEARSLIEISKKEANLAKDRLSIADLERRGEDVSSERIVVRRREEELEALREKAKEIWAKIRGEKEAPTEIVEEMPKAIEETKIEAEAEEASKITMTKEEAIMVSETAQARIEEINRRLHDIDDRSGVSDIDSKETMDLLMEKEKLEKERKELEKRIKAAGEIIQ